VALTEIDRNLLKRCLAEEPGAWKDFVDRFMGLFVHVVTHTAKLEASAFPRKTATISAPNYSSPFWPTITPCSATLRQEFARHVSHCHRPPRCCA